MPRFLLNLTLTLFVLGGTVCPCAAQFAAAAENHVAGHAGHHDGHGATPAPVHGDHHCESCVEFGAASNRPDAGLLATSWPTFDDDEQDPAPVEARARTGAPQGGAPPLRFEVRATSSPVSLGDRLIE